MKVNRAIMFSDRGTVAGFQEERMGCTYELEMFLRFKFQTSQACFICILPYKLRQVCRLYIPLFELFGSFSFSFKKGKVTDKLCEDEIDELDEGEDVQGVGTHARPIDRLCSGIIIFHYYLCISN